MLVSLVSDILESEGALIERLDENAAQTLLPESLCAALGLPEDPVLCDEQRPGTVFCGYGSELLQASLQRALARQPVALARVAEAAPRPGVPDCYTGINVALRPALPASGTNWTLIGHFLVDATADDRRQQRIAAAVSLSNGAPVTIPPLSGVSLLPCDDRPEAIALESALVPLARAASRAAIEAVAGFREAVARRNRRDLLRIHRYFRELDADLHRRIARSKNPAALVAKRELLPGEQGRRLQSLRENYAIRARVSPIAFVMLLAPAASAEMAVLRRKQRRTVVVHYHPLTRRWEGIACERCGVVCRVFGACDDRVHILCPSCLQSAGRQCPCCRGESSRRPDPNLLPADPEAQAQIEMVAVPDYLPDSPFLAAPGFVSAR